MGFSGVSSNCQSIQATFTLSNNSTTYDFTTDGGLDALPGIYTTYKQEGNTLTVYVTAKSGVLTDNGTLSLGTISADDGTHFTVEKASGVKVVGSDHSETTYPSVDQGGSTGGSDNGSNGSDNGSGGSDNGSGGSDNGSGGSDNGSGGSDNGSGGSDNGSGGSDSGNNGGGSTGGSNGGTSTTSRPITIQSSFGGKVIASAAEAIPGKVITLTATPNSGYALQSLKVTTASGKAVSLTRQRRCYLRRRQFRPVVFRRRGLGQCQRHCHRLLQRQLRTQRHHHPGADGRHPLPVRPLQGLRCVRPGPAKQLFRCQPGGLLRHRIYELGGGLRPDHRHQRDHPLSRRLRHPGPGRCDSGSLLPEPGGLISPQINKPAPRF